MVSDTYFNIVEDVSPHSLNRIKKRATLSLHTQDVPPANSYLDQLLLRKKFFHVP